MQRYKNYPIYGSAIPRIGDSRWEAQGLVFAPNDKQSPMIEIRRLEATNLTFAKKEEAEEHGLQLCKVWIDEQTSKSK